MKLEAEELNFIKEATSKLNAAKSMLGDLELKKNNIFKQIDMLQMQMEKKEQELISKYGLNSVINIETGDVKQKES